MPSKVNSAAFQGNMRSPDSAEAKDTHGISIMPPPLLPMLNISRRAVSSEGFSSSQSLLSNSRPVRSISLGNNGIGHRRSTGHSRSQMTQSTKTSTSTDTSTEERQKEVDNPILRIYDIRNRLGKGAYGIVWEAYNKNTGSKVALKKIFDAFRNSTDSQRTYREIMFLREFGHHPNMIRLISVHRATNEQDIYLVFPYMDHDLHKLVKFKPEVLTNCAIRSIIYQVLIAVKYLHSAEVIHRDLKPANILMDTNLQVKVADFGLARSLTYNPENSFTNLDMINPVMTDYVATRWYRPPEILLSCKTYTKGVDMWSIGCILGEMLLKKPLFAGNSTIDQIQTILKSIETPRDEDIHELCQGSSNKVMNPSVVRAGLEEQGDPIEDIFQDSDMETVDFLERLLVFNPTKRINIDQALAHPYVSSVREPYKERICERQVRPPLSDDIKLKVDDYRRTIYDMIEGDQFGMSPGQKFKSHGDHLLSGIREGYFEEFDDVKSLQDGVFHCQQYQEEFRDYTNTKRPKSEEDYQQFLVPQDFDNEELLEYDISTPINELSAHAHFEDNNNNKNDKMPSWTNYGSHILTKSASDPSTNAVASNSADYTLPSTSAVERPIKNVSILTLPSENPNPKPFTVPMITTTPSPIYATTSTSMASGIEYSIGTNTKDNDDGIEKGYRDGGIIEKFQSLCQKYDINEEFDRLSNYKDKIDFDKVKKTQSYGDYEFFAKGDNDKTHSRKSSPNSWAGNISTKTPSQFQYYPKLPSLMEHRRDDGDNNNCKGPHYNDDVRKIQDLLTKDSAGFVNPYKPKGLKTSDPSCKIGDLCEDLEIRNSRSLPSQLGRDPDSLKTDDGLQFLKPLPDYPTSRNNNEGSQYQTHRYNNVRNQSSAKISQSRVEGSKSFQRRQDNPPSHHQSTRLQELFPNRDAIQERIQEMERRVKSKGVLSQESLNCTEGLILINGKDNTCNKNQQRLKLSGNTVKKFSFNRPAKREEPQLPARPYGGRVYDKKFHGPSFRRTLQSVSDSESSHFSQNNTGPHWRWKPTTADSGPQSTMRPTNDAEITRKSITHSAYFPHAGVTHPMSNYKHNVPDSREKLSSKTGKTNTGVSAVHSNSSYNSRGSQGPNQPFRTKDYKYSYPQRPPVQQQYTANVHYDPSENLTASGSGTIRASDLFELRNNVARKKRLGYNQKH